jgi:hypothetical protein
MNKAQFGDDYETKSLPHEAPADKPEWPDADNASGEQQETAGGENDTSAESEDQK